MVFCPKWVHIAGAVRDAIKSVTTPFLFIHQHDFLLLKDFDLNGLIATMIANPNIKHVRLNQNPRADSYTLWDGPVDQIIEGPHFVPLCRTFGWSDNDHVTRLDYYNDFVLPKCGHCAMEAALHPALQSSFEELGPIAQKPFGTYIYGEFTGGPYIFHLDGRGGAFYYPTGWFEREGSN